MRTARAVAFVCGVWVVPALAQSAAPDSESGRYAFSQVADGVLRLDTRTGFVSHCSRRDVGWACQTVPDERTVLENEIVRLQEENAALKKEIIARGGPPLPGGVKPPAASRELTLRLPSDAELDRAMAFFENVWKRLVEMVHKMHRELEKKT